METSRKSAADRNLERHMVISPGKGGTRNAGQGDVWNAKGTEEIADADSTVRCVVGGDFLRLSGVVNASLSTIIIDYAFPAKNGSSLRPRRPPGGAIECQVNNVAGGTP
jgi:hypothetical protein